MTSDDEPTAGEVLRYAAFTGDPAGGNPAGVVIDADGLGDVEMQAVAAEVGYSETAFLVRVPGEPGAFDVRYFSPEAEVPFCGHATVAAAVALVDHGHPGPFTFRTASGEVPVLVANEGAEGDADEGAAATLTSVLPEVRGLDGHGLHELLECLGWSPADLDPALPVRLSYAGAWHPVVPVASRQTLAGLEYDFDRLRALMEEGSWTTVQVVWREDATCFHARNPFPVGGVVEDPATGAAAAALGAYLVDVGAARPPERIEVVQGVDMGRPSRLVVEVVPGDPRVRVTGQAVPIPS